MHLKKCMKSHVVSKVLDVIHQLTAIDTAKEKGLLKAWVNEKMLVTSISLLISQCFLPHEKQG